MTRILLGTIEVARHLFDLARAFRQLGHQAHTAVQEVNWTNPDLHYDYQISSPFSQAANRSTNPLVRLPRGIANRIYRGALSASLSRRYDVYVFQFGGSLKPENADFPALKRRGAKIVSIFNGDDIRHWSAAEPVWESFGLRFPPQYHDLPAEANDINQKLLRLRMAELYADVILSVPAQSELALRPYRHVYLPLDLAMYEHRIPERDVPVVVHAPTFNKLKGTERILEVLEQLRGEGVRFELRLLEKKTNAEVRRNLTEADVVVDQLEMPFGGMLSLESMASGCAVAGGNKPDFVPLPPDRPILHIDRTNVYEQLRRLLTDKPLRLQFARAGRPYVERYHEYVAVGRHMLSLLDGGVPCDYVPDFYARGYELPAGTTLSPRVLELTLQVAQRHGLPDGVDPRALVARGLMAAPADYASIPVQRGDAC